MASSVAFHMNKNNKRGKDPAKLLNNLWEEVRPDMIPLDKASVKSFAVPKVSGLLFTCHTNNINNNHEIIARLLFCGFLTGFANFSVYCFYYIKAKLLKVILETY